MKRYICHIIQLSVCLLFSLLAGCGSENAPQSENSSQTSDVIDSPPIVNDNSNNFKRITFDNQRRYNLGLLASNQVVGTGYLDASGSLDLPTPSRTVNGNLTILIDGVTDPVGVKRILLSFATVNTAVELCNETCQTPYSKTLTGVNPASFGLMPGIITAQIWLEDNAGNLSIVDSIAINWQPHRVAIDTFVRDKETVAFSWLPIEGAHLYNAYIARQPIDNVLNVLELLEGQQVLALTETAYQFSQLNTQEVYFVKVTGVDASGESAFSDNRMVSASEIILPSLESDHFTLFEGELISGNVLDNDDALGFDPLIVETTAVREPHSGRLDLFADGRFTYLPNQGFVGTDTFRYRVTNRQGAIAEAEVILTVVKRNEIFALADRFELKVNQTLVVAAPGVLINDYDSAGTTLTVNVPAESLPLHGALTLFSDGSFEYVPNTDFEGEDNFKYRVENDLGDFAVGEVLLTIKAQQPPNSPVAVNDFYTTNEDQVLNIAAPGLLENDTDESKETLKVVSHSPSINGTLTISEDGSFQYVPNANFSGQEIIEYTINNQHNLAASAQLIIDIVAVNDPPVAVDDNLEVNSGELSILEPLENDYDIDGSISDLTIEIVQPPNHGSAEITSENKIAYKSELYFRETDLLAYRIKDTAGGVSNTAIITIAVNGTNNAPIANDDTAETLQAEPINIQLLLNDEDLDGSLVQNSVAITVAPINGIVTVNASGEATYTPNRPFYGEDSFYYQVRDNEGALSNQAKVIVNVIQTNTAPLAVADFANTFVNSPIEIAILENDSDVDNNLDINSLEIVDSPVMGTASLTIDKKILFNPASGFIGEESFTYRVYDDFQVASNIATVTVSVLAPPIVNDDVANTNENNALTINVLENDDPGSYEFDLASLMIDTMPLYGNVEIVTGTAEIVYTPNTDYDGTDSFSYSIATTTGIRTPPATVTITVNNVNKPPVAVDDTAVVEEGSSVIIAVLNNDTDEDGSVNAATLTVVSYPANGEVTSLASGEIHYTPNYSFVGNDSFSYRVQDNEGAFSNIASVNVEVTTFNAVPVVNDIEASIYIDAVDGFLIANVEVENEEEQTLSYSLYGSNSELFELNENGELIVANSFQIQANGVQTYTLTLDVCDSGVPSKCAEAQIIIDVIELDVNEVVTLDSNFADNGKLKLQLRSTLEYHAQGKAILTETGQIIYASAVGHYDEYLQKDIHKITVSRMTENGHLDSGFADKGVFITDLGMSDNLIAAALVMDDQKRIYIAGYQEIDNKNMLFILRLTGSGVLDTSYGDGNGYVIISPQVSESLSAVDISYETNGIVTVLVNVESIDINDNGSVPINPVVVGSDVATRLMRINSSGNVVQEFEINTSEILPFTANIRSSGLLTLPDDDYLVYGAISDPTEELDAFFAKVDRVSLSLDSSYKNNGIFSIDLSEDDKNDRVLAATLTNDNYIIATGTAYFELNSSESLFALKMSVSGDLEPTFNETGYKVFDTESLPSLPAGLPNISEFSAQGKGIAKIDDAYFITLSRKDDYEQSLVQQWIKLDSNGVLDASWGQSLSQYNNEGLSTTAILSDSSQLYSYGVSQTELCCDNFSQLWISSVNTDGNVNTNFANQGKVVFDTAPSEDKLVLGLSVSDEADSAFILAGESYNYNGKDVPYVTQFTSDGQADLSFANYSQFLVGFDDYASTTSLTKGLENDIYLTGKQGENKAFVIKLSEQGKFDSNYGVQIISGGSREAEISQIIEESASRQWLLSKKIDYCENEYTIKFIQDGSLDDTTDYHYDLDYDDICNNLAVTIDHIDLLSGEILAFGVDSVNYSTPRLMMYKTELLTSPTVSFGNTLDFDIDIGMSTGQNASLKQVIKDNSGQYLLFGHINSDLSGHVSNFIARVSTTGSLDESFANSGVFIFESLNEELVKASSAWLKVNDKLVLAAQAKSGARTVYLLQLKLEDHPGTLDESFNSIGYQSFAVDIVGNLKFVISREEGNAFLIVIENLDPTENVIYSGQFQND